MKKSGLFIVLFLLAGLLCADDSWFIIKEGKMVSGGGFIKIIPGSPTTMLTLGFYKDPQGNDKLEALFTNDGRAFWPVPAELSGGDIMHQGFVTDAVFLDKNNIGAIRNKMEGSGFNMTMVIAYVTTDIFHMNLFNIVHVFDKGITPSGGSLSHINGKLYLGTGNASVLISEDGGNSWQEFPVTTHKPDKESLAINAIFAADGTHLFAAGGAIKEPDAIDEEQHKTILPYGGVWESTDGGHTWTALKEGMTIDPQKLIVTPDGTIFVKYMNEEDINSQQNPLPTHTGFSKDNMASFEKQLTPTTNTGKNISAVRDISYGDGVLWIVGIDGSFAPVTAASGDNGVSWIEYFLPPLGEGMMVMPDSVSVLDKRHVYAGFTNTAIAKFGDINEDYSDIPDETADTDSVQEADDSDSISQTDEETADSDTAPTDTEDANEQTDDSPSSVQDESGCSLLIVN